MSDTSAGSARARDSVANTLLVSILMSLIASVLVATTAIMLKPVQERNQERYRQQIILDVAGLWTPGTDVDAAFSAIETHMVDLESGDYRDDLSAEGFDAVAAAKAADTGVRIPADEDIANIHRRARYAPVYLVREDDRLSQVILPIYGQGLWSTMFGFLSLDADGNTVRGLRFYEHAETPGLGDQVDKPEWRAQWAGKKLFAGSDVPRIAVIRGRVDNQSADAAYQVDGLSGATLTGRGVTNLVRYWTGPEGFGPYLDKLHAGVIGDD